MFFFSGGFWLFDPLYMGWEGRGLYNFFVASPLVSFSILFFHSGTYVPFWVEE